MFIACFTFSKILSSRFESEMKCFASKIRTKTVETVIKKSFLRSVFYIPGSIL